MNWNILMDSLSIITLSCYENIVKCSSTDIKNIYMFYSVSNSVFTSRATNGAAGPCKQNKNERQTWPTSMPSIGSYNKSHLLAFALKCTFPLKDFLNFLLKVIQYMATLLIDNVEIQFNTE